MAVFPIFFVGLYRIDGAVAAEEGSNRIPTHQQIITTKQSVKNLSSTINSGLKTKDFGIICDNETSIDAKHNSFNHFPLFLFLPLPPLPSFLCVFFPCCSFSVLVLKLALTLLLQFHLLLIFLSLPFEDTVNPLSHSLLSFSSNAVTTFIEPVC